MGSGTRPVQTNLFLNVHQFLMQIIFKSHVHFFFLINMLPRWEESPSEELGELHPLKAENLVPEKLETEVLQKQEEEELGILQYLDQLEQVTARYFGRFVIKI